MKVVVEGRVGCRAESNKAEDKGGKVVGNTRKKECLVESLSTLDNCICDNLKTFFVGSMT